MFRRFYGPTHRAFSALSPSGQVELFDDMALLLGEWNRGGTRSLVVPAEYLEVVVETRGARQSVVRDE